MTCVHMKDHAKSALPHPVLSCVAHMQQQSPQTRRRRDAPLVHLAVVTLCRLALSGVIYDGDLLLMHSNVCWLHGTLDCNHWLGLDQAYFCQPQAHHTCNTAPKGSACMQHSTEHSAGLQNQAKHDAQ